MDSSDFFKLHPVKGFGWTLILGGMMKLYRVFKWTALMSLISMSSNAMAEQIIYNNGYKNPGQNAISETSTKDTDPSSTPQNPPGSNLKPMQYNGVQPSNYNNNVRTSPSKDYNSMGPNTNPYREGPNRSKNQSHPLRYNGMGPISYNNQPVRYRGQANYPQNQRNVYNKSYNNQPVRVSNPQYSTNSGRVVRSNGQVTYQNPSPYYNTNSQPIRYPNQNSSQPEKNSGEEALEVQNNKPSSKELYSSYKTQLNNNAEQSNPAPANVEKPEQIQKTAPQTFSGSEEDKSAQPAKQFQLKTTPYRVKEPNNPLDDDQPPTQFQQEEQKSEAISPDAIENNSPKSSIEDLPDTKQTYEAFKKNLKNNFKESKQTIPAEEHLDPKVQEAPQAPPSVNPEKNNPVPQQEEEPAKNYQLKAISYRVTAPNRPLADDHTEEDAQQEESRSEQREGSKNDPQSDDETKTAPYKKNRTYRPILNQKTEQEHAEQNKKNQLERDINHTSYQKSSHFRSKRNGTKNIAQADMNQTSIPQDPPLKELNPPQKPTVRLQNNHELMNHKNNPGFLDIDNIPTQTHSSNQTQDTEQTDPSHPSHYFKQEKKNLLEVAKDNPNLSTFVSALEATGLDQKLKEEGPFTIFVPSNDAFKQLPRGALERLMKPENQRQLFTILSYHIIPGKLASKDMKTASVKTISGNELNIEVSRGNINIDDSEVVKSDLPASNGVIHIIDEVLLPN